MYKHTVIAGYCRRLLGGRQDTIDEDAVVGDAGGGQAAANSLKKLLLHYFYEAIMLHTTVCLY